MDRSKEKAASSKGGSSRPVGGDEQKATLDDAFEVARVLGLENTLSRRRDLERFQGKISPAEMELMAGMFNELLESRGINRNDALVTAMVAHDRIAKVDELCANLEKADKRSIFVAVKEALGFYDGLKKNGEAPQRILSHEVLAGVVLSRVSEFRDEGLNNAVLGLCRDEQYCEGSAGHIVAQGLLGFRNPAAIIESARANLFSRGEEAARSGFRGNG